jgi:hypothetical protein
MAPASVRNFVSYARADSQLALKLASDLKAAGVDVWLDEGTLNAFHADGGFAYQAPATLPGPVFTPVLRNSSDLGDSAISVAAGRPNSAARVLTSS